LGQEKQNMVPHLPIRGGIGCGMRQGTNHRAADEQLEAHNEQNQPSTNQRIRKTDSVTEIRITVGAFESRENRTEARQIYDARNARY